MSVQNKGIRAFLINNVCKLAHTKIYKVFVISGLVYFLIGGIFLSIIMADFDLEKVNLFDGYKEHLNIILIIKNPLEVFSDPFKTAFALFDLIYSFLLIPVILSLFSNHIEKRIKKEVTAKIGKEIFSFSKSLLAGNCPYCGAAVDFGKDNGQNFFQCKGEDKHKEFVPTYF